MGQLSLSGFSSINMRAVAQGNTIKHKDATTGEGLAWLFPAIQLQIMNCSGLTSSSWRKQDTPSPRCQRWKKTHPEGNLINRRLFWVLNKMKLLKDNWAWFVSHQTSGREWCRAFVSVERLMSIVLPIHWGSKNQRRTPGILKLA